MNIFTKIKNAIQQPPTARTFWIVLAVLVLYLVIQSIGFYLIPTLMGYTGKLQIFEIDNTYGYTPQQVYIWLVAYGNHGRRAYEFSMILFDFMFPVLYGYFFSLGLRLIAKSMYTSLRVQRVIAILPFIVSAADWVENICILTMLFIFPRSLIFIAQISNVMTLTKLTGIAICFGCLFLGGIYLLFLKFLHKKE